METIYKYPLEVADEQLVTLPLHAKILSVKNQREKLVMYAEVDSETIVTYRVRIYIIGTGNPRHVPKGAIFLNTVIMAGGNLVWHVYAKKDWEGLI